MSKRTLTRFGLVAAFIALIVTLGLATAGSVGGRTDGSTEGTPRIGVPSSVLSARTPVPPAVGMGDGGQPIQAPTPAGSIVPRPDTRLLPTSSSDDAADLSGSMAPATVVVASASTAAPTVMPTVLVSSLPPPASSLEAAVRAAVERWFPASEWATAMRVAACETHGTYNVLAVGAAGEIGVWQINPAVWGAVPGDIDGQTRLAASIVTRYGWGPWSCR